MKKHGQYTQPNQDLHSCRGHIFINLTVTFLEHVTKFSAAADLPSHLSVA